jgi:hypothetical protein
VILSAGLLGIFLVVLGSSKSGTPKTLLELYQKPIILIGLIIGIASIIAALLAPVRQTW